jgi:hypothetical protein
MLSSFLESEEVLGFIFLIGKDNKWGLLHVASLLNKMGIQPLPIHCFFINKKNSPKKKLGKFGFLNVTTFLFIYLFLEKDCQIFNITKIERKKET